MGIWAGSPSEKEREDPTAFGRYRLSLAYLLVREQSEAQSAKYEFPAQQPHSIHAQVAKVLWHSCLTGGDLRAASTAEGGFAAEHAKTGDVLADYGYANPTFTPDEVCPIILFQA